MTPERDRLTFRILGLLPLAFFIAQGVHYWRINELGHMLWMCNIGNLILALGLFLERPALIRVAALWMIPGLVVWFVYVVLAWGVFLTSTMAHVGGLVVAMFALKRIGMDQLSWLYALLWYLGIQVLSRFFTPRELNVNVAHTIEGGWQQTFSSYWTFWLVLTLSTAVVLWAIGLMLRLLWPAEKTLNLSEVSTS
jgi:hypothetical protein